MYKGTGIAFELYWLRRKALLVGLLLYTHGKYLTVRCRQLHDKLRCVASRIALKSV